MAVLLSESYKSLPKWVKETILSELKPLFLRVRCLDESKKNCVLKNFFILLFPTFANNHHEKVVVISKEFRKTYNNWRNVLWKKLVERYDKYKISESNNPDLYLKKRHVNEVFAPWLKYTSEELPEESKIALKNLIIFGFYCIENFSDAHNKFFSFNGSLFTVTCDFPSSSGYNIATSMDLSKHSVVLSSYNNSDDSDDSN